MGGNKSLNKIKGLGKFDFSKQEAKNIVQSKNITYISTITDLQKNFNGDYICFLQSGDKLSKNSLFKVSQFLNKNIDSDMVYTDHDYFDEDNLRINPFFKPDWSSYLFDSVDYISQFLVTKKEIFNKIQFGDDFTNLKY